MGNFAEGRQTTIPLNERIDLLDDQERIELIHMIDFARCRRDLHEQLYQLHSHGPLWDGDVISKSDRDELLAIDACAKVCVKGQDGYNACTYFGRSLLSIFDWLHGKLGAPAQEDRAAKVAANAPVMGSA